MYFICDCNSFFNVGNAIAKTLKTDKILIKFYFIKKTKPQPFEEMKAPTSSG